MKKKSLRDKALETCLHSRFVAREEDLGRPLTDDETREEIKYLLETIPYAGHEEDVEREMIRQLRRIYKG